MAAVTKSGLDKNNKYDRQLRLWGDHGQSALESSRVCLINATATGTEILKNLILPGIGSFTIVDDKKVEGDDVGNNFFLLRDSIGTPRGKIACELLSELNEDVVGDFVEESTSNLIENNPSFFTSFSIVIATNMDEKNLLKLGELLYKYNVPLLVCRCYGFIGYIRLVLKEHTVIESHPDNTLEDLRLDRPIPAFQQFCDSLDLCTMTKKDHSHTPWLVIVYKYLQQWKNTHNGAAPINYKEKTQLKELIKTGILRNEEGVPDQEENFDEAVKHVNTALAPTKVPSEILKLFDDPECLNLTPQSKAFWIMIRAVKQFVETDGQGALPLRGTIPDMTADSERYIKLQNIYRHQANQDCQSVSNSVQRLVEEQCQNPENISEKDIHTFCRNSAFLRVIRCRSLEEEYNPQTANTPLLGQHLEDEEESDIIFYVLLRAVDKFYEKFNHYPGFYTQQLESDVQELKVCLSKLIQEWSLPPVSKDDYVQEMCRYGASELHTIAAFIGGIAAQEAIKIMTGQFLPIDNTYIYNAMKQTSITVEL
ncbi:hypothetical protein LOTGIDRAFT_231724 [Lottia gigantea]|uniref:NEDD8-activating enzyme E1 regulatory subunit n=1 Tax=Lottia gigantea TaxID=225164 RepID=V4AT84_LOTGI|nr:hypothetical protein LOTGIDRAFT_231724 [Lottia gigantea]ESO96926.1 hypothetical protein LOTGIDRAFT_231724 [Lottia gigantea]